MRRRARGCELLLKWPAPWSRAIHRPTCWWWPWPAGSAAGPFGRCRRAVGLAIVEGGTGGLQATLRRGHGGSRAPRDGHALLLPATNEH